MSRQSDLRQQSHHRQPRRSTAAGCLGGYALLAPALCGLAAPLVANAENAGPLGTAKLRLDDGGTTIVSTGGTLSGIGGGTNLTVEGGTTVLTGTNLLGNVTIRSTLINEGVSSDDLDNAGTLTNQDTYNADIHSNTGAITNAAGASWNGTVESGANTAGGTILNQGTWTGNASNDGGTIDNAATGTWQGSITNNSGATANTGSFTNEGTVSGAVINTGAADNSGLIEGGVTNSATFTNRPGATISGGIVNTAGTFDNSGTINGASSVSGGTLTNNGAMADMLTLTGGTLVNNGGATLGGLTIAGSQVVAGSSGTIGTLEVDDGAFTNNQGGTVNGTAVLTGGTVTNNGTFAGTVTQTGGTLVNNADGTIAGLAVNGGGATNNGSIADLSVADGTFTNDGSVSGNAGFSGGASSNDGALAGATTITGGTLVNNATGTIAALNEENGSVTNNGATTALTLSGGTFINNGSGTINGTAMLTGGTLTNNGTLAALTMAGTGNFINNASGIVNGAVTADGTATGNNGGTLAATLTLASSYGGTFTNSGAINGLVTVSGGTLASTGVLSGGLDNAATVVASGTINGGIVNTAGASLTLSGTLAAGGALDNAGLISLGNNPLSGITTLTNTGTITSQQGGWITAGTLINRGTITGTDYGLALAGPTALTNYGTISGTTGSILLGANGNTLALMTGSSLAGAVNYNGTSGNLTRFGAGSWVIPVLNYNPDANSIVDSQSGTSVATTVDASGDGTIRVNGASPLISQVPGAMHSVITSIGGIIGGVLDIEPPTAAPAQDTAAPAHPLGYAAESTPAAAAAARAVLLNADTAVDGNGNLVWLRGATSGLFQSATETAVASQLHTSTATVGFDREVEDWRLGAYAGGGTMATRFSETIGSVDGSIGFGGLYGKTSIGIADFAFDLTGGLTSSTVKRDINGGVEIASGTMHGWFVTPSATISTRYALAEGIELTPALTLRYEGSSFGAYQESGSDDNAGYAASSSNVLEERATVKASWHPALTAMPDIRLSALGGLVLRQRLSAGGILATIDGGTATFSETTPQAVAGGLAGLTAEVSFSPSLSLVASVNGTVYSDSEREIDWEGGIRYRF